MKSKKWPLALLACVLASVMCTAAQARGGRHGSSHASAHGHATPHAHSALHADGHPRASYHRPSRARVRHDYAYSGSSGASRGVLSSGRTLSGSSVGGRSGAALAGVGAVDGCSCGSGVACTGPRGGQYCYTRSGHKHYIH